MLADQISSHRPIFRRNVVAQAVAAAGLAAVGAAVSILGFHRRPAEPAIPVVKDFDRIFSPSLLVDPESLDGLWSSRTRRMQRSMVTTMESDRVVVRIVPFPVELSNHSSPGPAQQQDMVQTVAVDVFAGKRHDGVGYDTCTASDGGKLSLSHTEPGSYISAEGPTGGSIYATNMLTGMKGYDGLSDRSLNDIAKLEDELKGARRGKARPSDSDDLTRTSLLAGAVADTNELLNATGGCRHLPALSYKRKFTY